MEFKRYLIVILGIVSMLAMGTIYSWSVFRAPLEEEMGLSPMQTGLPFLVFLAMYAFSMPFAGMLIEKFKPFWIAITGSLLLSSGYIITGFCDTISQIVVFYGILGGIGVGFLYGVPVAMAARWFPNSKGLATGASLLGFGLSPFITAPIASTLIDNYGVSYTFRVIGLAFIVLLPVVSLFFMNPPNYTNKKSEHVISTGRDAAQRNKIFLKLWVLFFIVTFSGLMTISISSPFTQELLKAGTAQAAVLLSLFAVFNGLGRLLFGVMIDKVGLRKTMISTFLVLIISSLVITNVTHENPAQFIVSMCFVWGVFGAWLTIAPVSVYAFLGEHNAARNYGKLFTAYGFGAIAGVTLASKVKEITGSFQMVFYVVFVLALLGLFINIFIYNHK